MFRLSLVLLLLAPLSRLHAQDDEDWRVLAGAGFASRRVFRGVERSGDAAQASADLAGNGFRGGIWTSQPFKGSEPGETDLHAGYDLRVSGQFTVGVTATQYVFSNTRPGATRQSTEAGIEVTWTTAGGLSAGVGGFHDFRLHADTLQARAGYSLPLKNIGAYLNLEAYVGCSDGSDLRPDAGGPAVGDSYSFAGLDATLPYRVGMHTTLVAGGHFSTTQGQSSRWSPIAAAGGAHGWITFAVNVDF